MTSPGGGGCKRHRRTSTRPSSTYEPLLDKPIDDPDGGGMGEANRLAQELHGPAGELRDRDQRRGRRARVTDRLLGLEPEPVSDGEDERAEQVLATGPVIHGPSMPGDAMQPAYFSNMVCAMHTLPPASYLRKRRAQQETA